MSRSAASNELPREPRALFEGLYRRHFGLVWALVRRSSLAPAHHEDVVQDVWLTVHRRLHSYDPEASAAGWIAAITRFVLWRHARGVARARRKLTALSAAQPEVIDPIEGRDVMALVDAALERLDPIHRETLLLVEIDGLTGPEIADRLGVPLNTVYSRVRTARERMQVLLAELDESEQRDDGRTPKGAAERTWAALVPVLEGGTTVVAVVTKTSWAITAAVVAVAGAAIFGVARLTAPETNAKPVPAAHATEPVEAPPAADRPVGQEHVTAPISRPIEPPMDESVAEPAKDRPLPRSEPPPSHDRDVGEESALLSAAVGSIAEGDGQTALRLLHDHEKRFPSGELVIERRAARVRALCLVGKKAQARGEAAILLRDHPSVPAAVAVRDACEGR